MAISIDSIESLQRYLQGVLHRAEHHANNIEGVTLTLLGAIISVASDEIKVREFNGRPANVIWFSVGANNYAMTYNHSDETIDLHERNQNGNVIAQFDDAVPQAEIVRIFRNL